MPDVGCAGFLAEDTFCGPMAALPNEGALMLLDAMPVHAGGCAANVAIDLAKQNVSVDVVGCVGEDSAAQMMLGTFDAFGVGSAGVVRLPGSSTSKTVILLIEGQDRRYLHLAGANMLFGIDHVSREWLAGLKIFYLGGLFALPGIDLGKLAGLLAYCRSIGVTTVVDVVVPQQDRGGMEALKPLLPLIDLFVPNDDEARTFTGLTDPIDQLRDFRAHGANKVIITRGRQGSVACDGEQIWSCGTYAMDVVDPSGSGDAFTSGVIRGLLMGWDMPRTLQYASAVGASATRATGTTTSVFSAAEAEAFLNDHPIRVTHES